MGRPADPLTRLRNSLPKAQRLALETTFRYWHRHFAPLHFAREAFSRYTGYAESAKRDLGRWLERHAQDIAKGRADASGAPAVRSGKLEQAFLHGSYIYTGGPRRLRVTWPTVPRHATLRNRYSGFQPASAVTEVAPGELDTLGAVYQGTLDSTLRDLSRLRDKSYGRAVLRGA